MTKKEQIINKLVSENKLKKYDSINFEFGNYYLVYGTKIVRHNEIPTLTTQCNINVVVEEL